MCADVGIEILLPDFVIDINKKFFKALPHKGDLDTGNPRTFSFWRQCFSLCSLRTQRLTYLFIRGSQCIFLKLKNISG